ncbi:MAG: hypothetical protein AAFY88_20570, partial [Acidobacteriota bacterium]
MERSARLVATTLTLGLFAFGASSEECQDQVPFMTGPTSPSGAVISSGQLSEAFPAWRAFDDTSVFSTFWLSEVFETPAQLG